MARQDAFARLDEYLKDRRSSVMPLGVLNRRSALEDFTEGAGNALAQLNAHKARKRAEEEAAIAEAAAAELEHSRELEVEGHKAKTKGMQTRQTAKEREGLPSTEAQTAYRTKATEVLGQPTRHHTYHHGLSGRGGGGPQRPTSWMDNLRTGKQARKLSSDIDRQWFGTRGETVMQENPDGSFSMVYNPPWDDMKPFVKGVMVATAKAHALAPTNRAELVDVITELQQMDTRIKAALQGVGISPEIKQDAREADQLMKAKLSTLGTKTANFIEYERLLGRGAPDTPAAGQAAPDPDAAFKDLMLVTDPLTE